MARFYKLDSPVHQEFEKLFKAMDDAGISMDTGSGARFFLSEKTYPNILQKDRDIEIVDAETGEEVGYFPPITEFRVKVWNS